MSSHATIKGAESERPPSEDDPLTTQPSTTNQLENRMEQAFLADRAATKKLGWISTISWATACSFLTAGGLFSVLARQQDNEGLRLALVAISVPGMFALLLGIVTAVLWSRRSQRLTLESLQDRLARIESLLRND